MMREKICLIIAVVVFVLTISSYKIKSIIHEKNDTPDTTDTTEQTEEVLFDVPSGLTKKYEKADFDKYNSNASDNGLAGTAIWFEGEMGDITTTTISNEEDVKFISSIITLDDGNKWLAVLDADSNGIDKYSGLKNHCVCVFGKYQGFSNTYEMPTICMSSLFDRNDGNMINTTVFDENQPEQNVEIDENGKQQVNEFDPSTNQKEECFGVHLELPSTWDDKKEDGDNIFYYSPGSQCMISFTSFDATDISLNEELVNGFLDGIAQVMSDYELLSMDKSNVKSDGRDAYNVKFSYTLGEKKLASTMFTFLVSDGLWAIMYTDFDDVDRSQDFEKVIDSITFEEESGEKITKDTSGVTPSFKATMDKYEKFFDEYADFMKRYADSDYSPDMLTDYMELLTTYSEYMEELEKIENDKNEMTNEDWAYYIDVNARIQKKLLEVSQ